MRRDGTAFIASLAVFILVFFYIFTDFAFAQSECGDTKDTNISDFVDPNGFPSGRDGPKPLTVDPTLIIFSVFGGPIDPPQMLPKEWKTSSSNIDKIDKLTFYENGNKSNYRILRFDKPVALCNLLLGWEAWQRHLKDTPNSIYKAAFFVFLSKGEQQLLTNDLVLTLGPGVSPYEFQTRIFHKELTLRNDSSGKSIGYLDYNVFDAKIDSNTDLWKVKVRAADGVFPLRAANRIASYGTYGQPGWISRVDLVFKPLVSSVLFTTEFEQLRISGSAISMQKGEPISVPQLYAPGVRFRIYIDITRDLKDQPLFQVLTDASEYLENLIKAFEPKIEKDQIVNMGSGCVKNTVHLSRKYERTIFSCTFSVLTPADYQIKPISFRLAGSASGEEYSIDSGEEVFLFSVFTLRNKNQKSGVGGVRPLLTPKIYSLVSRKMPLAITPGKEALPGEPVVVFLSKNFVPPVKTLTAAFKNNPWEVVRTKGFVFFIISVAALLALLLIFSRWFGYPSPAKLFFITVGYLTAGIFGGIILPLVTLFLGAYGLRFFFFFVLLGKRVKNSTLEVIAGKWHIALPSEPSTFIVWALSQKRTMLEQLLAALYLRNLCKREIFKQAVYSNSEIADKMEAIENFALNAILTPFAVFAIRREIHNRERI